MVVCYGVLSGRTAGRSISTQIRTVQGDAKGERIMLPSWLKPILNYIIIDGGDYSYSYSSDSLDDGDSSNCVAIPILSDSIDEEEECFTVSLSSSSYAGLTLNPEIGTVCINDENSETVHCMSFILTMFFCR